MIATIVSLLLAGVLLLWAAFYSGKIASPILFGQGKSTDNGISLGIFILSAGIGTFYSSGKSLYCIPFILILVTIALLRRKAAKLNYSITSQEYLNFSVLISYFIGFFILQFFIFYKGSGEWAKEYADNYAYISQINLMSLTGLESVFAELENPQYGFSPIVRPYHYFEFWIAVGGKLISRQSGLLIYTLLLIPLLGSILLFQAYLFCKNHINPNRVLPILLPVLVFFTLRYSYLDEWLFILLRDQLEIHSKIYKAAFFQNYGFWHFFSYLHGLKLIITGIFLFPIIGFLRSNEERNYMIYFALLPLVSLSYVPVTAVFLVLYGLKRLIFGRIDVHFLMPVLSIVFVFLFYFLFSESAANSDFHLLTLIQNNLVYLKNNFTTEIFILVSDYFENYYWIALIPVLLISIVYTQWNIYALTCVFVCYPLVNFNHSVYFKIFLGLIFLFTSISFYRLKLYRYLNSDLVLLIGSVFIIRILLLLIGNLYDIFQMYSLLATPILYILIFLWLSSLFAKSRLSKYPTATVSFILVFICINTYGVVKENQRAISQVPEDKPFAEKILSYSGTGNKIVSAYYSPFTVKPYLHYDRIGMELMHHTDQFYTTCLSMDELTQADTLQLKQIHGFMLLENLPFSRWLATKADAKSSYWQEQLRFIQSNHIRFIFRKDEYDRRKLNFLHPLMMDSVYNHRGKYWAYILKVE